MVDRVCLFLHVVASRHGSALEHGCGATWLTGAYDPELDLLYWTVGNPCPDYNGEERLGDNLYTNSVLALRPKTGELVWYYQFTPHDTHDWDAQQRDGHGSCIEPTSWHPASMGHHTHS